ncbi:phenylalanine--tRNA ligase subunit beta [Candidatus Profftella armatura (Diaphorina cf. continua)]|uniref:Phenylalanine--tRNA ligase beta subunit n=1 Tax=Candidatus Profftella armatura (Diaphorina cf. continua) TaxID=2661583 RepID=A0A7R6VYK9_9PROT|nr:phenylalanine--tRNA ligase subunit beta [Candidatus Profftella armatura (Diaphorina cf. continua)]BCG49492.1 phenylalanine--tRNA ligase subunit beta [Candidatus Profftella armatura (Diaphorina cf. continua)]
MQIPENWLRTIIDPKLSSNDLADLLTMSGLEVEKIETTIPIFSKVIIGKIINIIKHPDIDNLNICKVDTYKNILDIVCNVPNIRVGLKVPCAIIGSSLPCINKKKSFIISVKKIHGIKSYGMLCSAYDLKINNKNKYLLELPEDAPIGKNFYDYYQFNNLKFIIKLTPNRGDCLSLFGIAREISILSNTPLKLLNTKITLPNYKEILPVKILAMDLCGRFSGRIIRGINPKTSTPKWMQIRLEDSGQKLISVLPDITNYVMLELGIPINIFDLSKIYGELNIRWGNIGETFKISNDLTININKNTGIISDNFKIISLSGIIEGVDVTVTLNTKDIYLGVAFWWPNSICGKANHYNLVTESSYRFERGIDFSKTIKCLERITNLIIEICGTSSSKISQIDDQIVNIPVRKKIKIRSERVIKVLGIKLTNQEISNIFIRLKFNFIQKNNIFLVTPPAHRFDIEIEEDLIEEIIRIYGFKNIPISLPITVSKLSPVKEGWQSLFSIRHQLAFADYQEVINYSFIEDSLEKDFSQNINNHPIELLNPISNKFNTMRSTLIGSLVNNVCYNLKRKLERIRLFEIANIYLHDNRIKDGPFTVSGYKESKKIAVISYGPLLEPQWGEKNRNIDYFDLKNDLENLFFPIQLKFSKINNSILHPNRSALILRKEKNIGFIGELHPILKQKYDLPLSPIFFEIDALELQKRKIPNYIPISKFPNVTRDIVFIFNKNINLQDIMNTMFFEKNNNSNCFIIQSITLFDEYRGKKLKENEKSFAFRCTLQDPKKTLKNNIINNAINALINSVCKTFNAKLRT